MPSVLALAGLSAVLGCSTPDFPDNQKKPELVQPGMSPRQVAAHVGPPFTKCWDYKDDQLVCFMDDMVNLYGRARVRDGMDAMEVHQAVKDLVSADKWPPDPPPREAKQVTIGMSPRQVLAIVGTPLGVRFLYGVDAGTWTGTFVDDRLTKFSYQPPMPNP